MSTDKIALVYEFKENSPLFARIAASELTKKNVGRAIEILEKGIDLYPNYPTPYFIYGLALANRGDKENAEEKIRKGCELTGSDEALEYYLKKIEEISAKNFEFSESRRTTFFLKEITAEETEELSQTDIPEDVNPEPPNFVDDLDTLAEEIRRAKIADFEEELDYEKDTGKSDEELDFQTSKHLISETLAGIYLAQGNIDEAIVTYEKLIEKYPEKSEYYQGKIREIKSDSEQEGE